MVEELNVHGDDAEKVESDNGWVVFGDGTVRVRSRCIAAIENGERLLVRTELAVYDVSCTHEDLLEAVSQADTHEQLANQPG